jgi:hypothetical protein
MGSRDAPLLVLLKVEVPTLYRNCRASLLLGQPFCEPAITGFLLSSGVIPRAPGPLLIHIVSVVASGPGRVKTAEVRTDELLLGLLSGWISQGNDEFGGRGKTAIPYSTTINWEGCRQPRNRRRQVRKLPQVPSHPPYCGECVIDFIRRVPNASRGRIAISRIRIILRALRVVRRCIEVLLDSSQFAV